MHCSTQSLWNIMPICGPCRRHASHLLGKASNWIPKTHAQLAFCLSLTCSRRSKPSHGIPMVSFLYAIHLLWCFLLESCIISVVLTHLYCQLFQPYQIHFAGERQRLWDFCHKGQVFGYTEGMWVYVAGISSKSRANWNSQLSLAILFSCMPDWHYITDTAHRHNYVYFPTHDAELYIHDIIISRRTRNEDDPSDWLCHNTHK